MTVREVVQALGNGLAQDRGFDRYICRLKKYKEHIELEARSRVFVWSFRPIRRAVMDLPIFYWADLLRFPTGVLCRKYPGRYLKFLFQFWNYKKNLRDDSWSSLSMIYHRPLVLWYYYSLFWWAEYCGVSPSLLNNPDLSLIPELFIRYIVKIDAIIDTGEGKGYLLDKFSSLKRNCDDVLDELLFHIWKNESGLDRKCQKRLIDTVWKFRQNSLIISRQAQRQPGMNFDELLEYKERTAGELTRVWVELLCDLYHAQRAENSKNILGEIAMAIQVIDDMLDSPIDHRDDVHNIFLHLLSDFPDEFEAATTQFNRVPYNHLDWVWANKHLPNTCRKAVDLIAQYTEKAYTISEDKSMTSELCEILLDWRLLNP